MDNSLQDGAALQNLRKSLKTQAAVGGVILLVAFGFLRLAISAGEAWIWLGLVLPVYTYQCIYIFRYLPENKKNPDAPLYASLGWANQITILRGFFLVMLAGFVFLPRPAGPLAWAPGILYLLAVCMDFLDGYLARVMGRVSLLGSRLDMEWDSIGFLIGAGAASFMGQIQPVYMLLGLARFIFVFGINRRNQAGKPVYDLDDSMVRRALAGTQMGFVAVALLPVFNPIVTQVASLLFMMPSLIHFWRDWLWVSGQIGRPHQRTRWTIGQQARFWFPLFLRAVMVLAITVFVLQELRQPVPDTAALILSSMALPALILGAAGRITALGMLVMVGFLLQNNPGQNLFWLLFTLGTLILIVGTGPYSVWTPENRLIYHRAGEVA